jgi:hypothetical protein
MNFGRKSRSTLGVACVAAVLLFHASSAQAQLPTSLPRLRLNPVMQLAESGSGGDGLDFDLLGDKKDQPPSPEALEVAHQQQVRRAFLSFHQVIGLSTLTMLAATVIVGQLNYLDRFAGGAPNTARWEVPHEVLATATLVGFATTGAVGLLAPKPDDKPRGFDTTAVHKICMGAAALGMAAELALGFYTAGHEGLANQKQLAEVHQYIGFSTFGFMTIGAGAFIF